MSNLIINTNVNPQGLKKDEYDCIIIGAGIGGLVCGCYLAKAGMKVLIVEQHHKVGGYCQSFTRSKFTFDTCVHYLGSYREDGQLRCVIEELDLNSRINMRRIDPSDILLTPQHKVIFHNNISRTIEGLQREFPSEKINIISFFRMISEGKFSDKISFSKKSLTFDKVLNEYFKNSKLKAVLAIPLVNLGLSADEIFSAAAVILYREFILDGGYYPEGGMQNFAELFAARFKELGGKIRLNTKAKRILINTNKVSGIMLQKEDRINSKCVVSNADAYQTFFDLIGEKRLPSYFITKIKNKIPSTSMFMVYLGINKQLNEMLPEKFGALWYWPMPEWGNSTLDITTNKSIASGFICSAPSMHESSYVPTGCESIRLATLASFKTKKFWDIYKKDATKILLKRAEKLFPDLAKHTIVEESATPQDLYKFTMNHCGAIYGWASLPCQADPHIDYKTPIQNLYLCSQWVSFFGIQGGVSMVGFVARSVASFILRKKTS